MREDRDRFVRALAESLDSALEEMFFVYDLAPCKPDVAPHGALGFVGAPIMARVDFKGAPSGAMTLRTGADSARALAANFLGEEESSLDAHQVEAVFAELANMVCGGVLTRTEPDCTFRLSSPSVDAAPSAVQTDIMGVPGAGYAVMLDSGPMLAELSIEEAR